MIHTPITLKCNDSQVQIVNLAMLAREYHTCKASVELSTRWSDGQDQQYSKEIGAQCRIENDIGSSCSFDVFGFCCSGLNASSSALRHVASAPNAVSLSHLLKTAAFSLSPHKDNQQAGCTKQ